MSGDMSGAGMHAGRGGAAQRGGAGARPPRSLTRLGVTAAVAALVAVATMVAAVLDREPRRPPPRAVPAVP